MLTKRGEGMAMKSLERYYDEAIRMLEEKDLPEFMLNIGSAIALAGEDKSKLAKLTYLKAKGLMAFQQHKKAVASIQEALEYNEGEWAFKLRKALGTAKGYLGDSEEALSIFESLLNEKQEYNNLFDIYIYLAWLYLNFIDKKEIEKSKYYLDLANHYFFSMSSNWKSKIYHYYSSYYYHKQSFDKAIEMLKNALDYTDEIDKAYILTNLAEIYIKYKNEDTSLTIQELIREAELLGEKYHDNIILGRAYYITALSELKQDQLVNALDSLNIAMEYYRKADAESLALNCLIKMNELIDEYKLENLRVLKSSIKTSYETVSLVEKF